MRSCMAVMAAGLVVLAASGRAEAVTPNGATAELEMHATLTLLDGLQLTFCPGHGMNGADAYVYTDVGGSVEEDYQYLGTWGDDTSSWSASASTSNGAASGSVQVVAPGFDYLIEAYAMVQGIDLGEHGLALGDGYGWPDWLRCDNPGTARLTIDYTYTLDTRDTVDNALAKAFMNTFFADHVQVNQLWDQPGWLTGPPNSNGTTNQEHSCIIDAGEYVTVTDSVSWDVPIPTCSEPNSYWSMWVYGEAKVEVAPVPEPATLGLLAAGVAALAARRRVA